MILLSPAGFHKEQPVLIRVVTTALAAVLTPIGSVFGMLPGPSSVVALIRLMLSPETGHSPSLLVRYSMALPSSCKTSSAPGVDGVVSYLPSQR
jgi:hypothetical protein